MSNRMMTHRHTRLRERPLRVCHDVHGMEAHVREVLQRPPPPIGLELHEDEAELGRELWIGEEAVPPAVHEDGGVEQRDAEAVDDEREEGEDHHRSLLGRAAVERRRRRDVGDVAVVLAHQDLQVVL